MIDRQVLSFPQRNEMSGKLERKRRARKPSVGASSSIPGSAEVRDGDKETSRFLHWCQVRNEKSILAVVGGAAWFNHGRVRSHADSWNISFHR